MSWLFPIPQESIHEHMLSYQEKHINVSVPSWLCAWSPRGRGTKSLARVASPGCSWENTVVQQMQTEPPLPWPPPSPKDTEP